VQPGTPDATFGEITGRKLTVIDDEGNRWVILKIVFFDLQGYRVLEGALSADEVAHVNKVVDAIPPLEPDEWHGHVHRQDHITRHVV